MGLTKVWLKTFTDGLIRADHVVGVSTHQTPALPGKSVNWLVDVTLAVSVGSGGTTGWEVSALHRTLIQTRFEPLGAAEALTELLARLHDGDPAGVITTRMTGSRVQFAFQPFATASSTTSSDEPGSNNPGSGNPGSNAPSGDDDSSKEPGSDERVGPESS